MGSNQASTGVFVVPWRYSDFNEMADRLSELGADTIHLSVKQSQGFANYRSDIAPRWAFDGDPLQEALDAFHRRDMRVFASTAVFADAARALEKPERLAVRQDGVPARPLVCWEEDWYYHNCPSQPEQREYMLRIVDEIASRYEVDGIDLDFIRFPRQAPLPGKPSGQFCFCSHCRSEFKKAHGVEASEVAETDPRWTSWRAEKITSFVTEASRLLKQSRPDAKLLMYIATYAAESAEPADVEKTRVRFGQDIPALGKIADVLSPMLYHQFMEPTSLTQHGAWWVRAMTRWISATGANVWTALQGENPVTSEDLGLVLEGAFDGGATGVVLYPGRSWLPNAEKRVEVERVFKAVKRSQPVLAGR